jgi:hypothetical protein
MLRKVTHHALAWQDSRGQLRICWCGRSGVVCIIDEWIFVLLEVERRFMEETKEIGGLD